MHEPIEAFRSAILAALGHAPDVIDPGKLRRFSTNGKRGDTSGWCKLFDDMRGGVFGDFRTGLSETWSAADRTAMTLRDRAVLTRQIMAATVERQAEQRRTWARNAERIASLWSECVPLLPGDPVTQYLKRRGFTGVWPLPACLRYHPALPWWHEGERVGVFPAMIAPLTAPDGRTVALHRTYLMRDGRKADVPTVKKLTAAAGPLTGASIALFQPAKGRIGIAEGIETSLAAWCASGVTTVAAYCANNLASWQWPIGVRRIVVFADHDPAGIDAAEKLRHRARKVGLSVTVMTPTETGADWCDVWAGRDAVQIEGAEA